MMTSTAAKNRLSIREMFALIGVEVDSDNPFPAHIASDSSDVRKGGAFVALEGERTDGHKYIDRAEQNGAALVIGRKGKCSSATALCVELDEPEQRLGDLAARYAEYAAPQELIAITGSVGKTTTREAAEAVVAGHFKVHAAERSLNTLIGCSMTILTMPLDTQVLLLEFGANSMGEIRDLTRRFPPTIAVITQVAPVHLAGFKSLAGVLAAKMEITESPRLKSFVYNGDNPLLRDAARALPDTIATCGVGLDEGQYRIQSPAFQVREGIPSLSFRLEARDGSASCGFSAGMWGEKLALPIAMAAIIGFSLGIPWEQAAEALKGFSGPRGRGRILPVPGSGGCRFVVDDAYNANPISMRSSLETFAALSVQGRKVAVLGDMRELGEDELRFHRELAPLLDGIDEVVFVGDLWKLALADNDKAAWHFVDIWQKAAEILERNDSWQALLVKGSNGLRLQNLVDRLAGGGV